MTGCVEDVTASVQSRSDLEVKAISDPLTGCLNRAGTLAVLQDSLDRAATLTERRGTAAIFVDLDQFKPVNDEFGHATGDEVLLRVAERIRRSVRSGDVVGRLGGDEFLVICPNVVNPETALAIARSLTLRAFGAPIDLGTASVAIRASLGVAWSHDRNTYATALVAQADAAMYRSKRQGRSEPCCSPTRRPEGSIGEADGRVAGIAERLVLRGTAPAEGDAVAHLVGLPVGGDDGDPPSHPQGPGHTLCRILDNADRPLEVRLQWRLGLAVPGHQAPGRTEPGFARGHRGRVLAGLLDQVPHLPGDVTEARERDSGSASVSTRVGPSCTPAWRR